MTDKEWMIQVQALIDDIGTTGQSTAQQTKLMFLLYNERLTPRETGTGCPPCVQRVWKNLKRAYGKIQQEHEDTND